MRAPMALVSRYSSSYPLASLFCRASSSRCPPPPPTCLLASSSISFKGNRIPRSFPAVTDLESRRVGSRHGAATVRRFCGVRATQVSDSGSIDSPMIHAMEKKIKEQLEADFVAVKDAYGDGRHVSIDVVSKAFEGQSAVNRQRLVYKAIWEELQSTVHAVDQMTTRTPAEAAAKN
ncbi:protein BOLA4, chloroplastic/mitochondrial [Typha angustifolia]|uniref:protein BOLA4, chloroplastic/mitochondrial n=1 Tax=Typha angustifolia TaxID=59011 RepID=UPI003C30BD88